MENVVAVSFAEPSKAYEALTKLKQLDQQDQIELQEGGVVERDATGQLVVKDRIGDTDDDAGIATASGGLLGLLIGVLGGPVGMLLGGTLGLATGGIIDLDTQDREEDETDSVLGRFARYMQTGQTAVLARLDEQSNEVVDSAMGGLGGNVLRRPAAEVEAELAAAAEARDTAEREARKKLRKERQEARKEEVDAKMDALRAKFRKSDTASSKAPASS
jgi:uncharacterized membrane protein